MKIRNDFINDRFDDVEDWPLWLCNILAGLTGALIGGIYLWIL